VSVARRLRRRRLLLVAIPLVVVVAILVLAAVVVTGRLVIPAISGRVYPIKYESEIGTVADKYSIDPYLLAAVARTESGFNPSAESGVGALGLMQLLPSTAKWVTTLDGWKGPKNPALTNPQDSLELGACYLSYLLHRFDNPTAVIAAYNAGPNKVASWIEGAGGSDSFSAADIQFSETKEFVRRVNYWRALFKKAHPAAFEASTTSS
jgi:soluble lytic murein transglycosylase